MKKLRRSHFLLVSALCAFSVFGGINSAPASDLSPTVTSVAMSAAGKSLIRNAGESISGAGKAVYLSTSDNRWYLCDNNLSLAASKFYGITLNGNGIGQPVRVCYKDPAFNLGVALVIGDTLWTSGTAGGITKTATDNATGMYVTCLGVANSTTTFNLNPTRADAIKP